MRITLTSCGLAPTPRRPGARASFAYHCRAARRTAQPAARTHNDPDTPAQPSMTVPARRGDAGPARAAHAASATLRVTTGGRDGCTVITAVGELDIATASRLTDALRHAPARAPIILDLTGVAFMDCTGLHPILRAHHAASAQHNRLILVPTPAITRLLRLTDLQHILPSRPTLPDALTAARTV